MKKRIIALVMVFVLAVGCMTGISLVSSDSVLEVQAADKSYKTGKNENYYVLSVETGAVSGDDVLYFSLVYTDKNGKLRTHFIFPHEKALQNGYKMIDELLRKSGLKSPAAIKRELMSNIYGVQSAINYTDNNLPCLQSGSVDEFFFTTDYEVKRIEGIEVCASQGDHNWYCEKVSIYQVEEIRGIDMVGYFSDSYFVDFAGNLLSVGTISSNIGNTTQDGVLVGFYVDSVGAKLWNNDDVRHELVKNYGIKIDMAQSDGAGIDGFVQDPLSCTPIGSRQGIGSYKECLTLYLKYQDISGIRRSVYIPVCTNMLCYLCNDLDAKNKYLYGIGQDSDSFIFPISLPGVEMADTDTKSIIEMKLFYSTEYALEKCHLGYLDNAREINGVNESIFISGVQVLKQMPKIKVDEANYRLTIGLNDDNMSDYIKYYQVSNLGGEQLFYRSYDGVNDPACLSYASRLARYNRKDKLVSSAAGDSYLVTMVFAKTPESQTIADVRAKLLYVDHEGIDRTTAEIDVNGAVNSFYGNWVTTQNTEGRKGAYYVHAVPGGELKFLVSIPEVDRLFGIKVSVSNEYLKAGKPEGTVVTEDEMSLDYVKVERLTSDGWGTLSYKYNKNKTIPDCSVKTYWEVTREYSLVGENVEDPNTKEKKEATLYGIHNHDEKYAGDFVGIGSEEEKELSFEEAKRAEAEKTINWNDYNHGMTYSQTKQDMGYTKQRCKYKVTVDIPNDKDTDEGDSGSKNQFYFKLCFETGDSSGYVLANQQLAADCFKSGRKESFYIYTNYDYGEVAGVKVIPDAQQNESDIYDKLKINEIIVTKEDKTASQNWICYVNNWVGIEYTDDGAAGAAKGQTSHAEAEIARTYPVTTTSYDVNLIFDIDTAEARGSEKQLTGSMSAYISYYDVDDTLLTEEIGDVYSCMYDYLGKSVKYANDNSGCAEIDQKTMMRPLTRNSFILSLNRVKSLNYIEFKAKNLTENCYWRCGGITVRQIIAGTGCLYLDSSGARVRDYDTLPVASAEDTSAVLYGGYSGNAGMIARYSLKSEQIQASYTDESKIGKIYDDSVNVYLHMYSHDEISATTDILDNTNGNVYFMDMIMKYSYNSGRRGIRTKTIEESGMKYHAATHTFYATLDAKGLQDILTYTLTVKDKSGKELTRGPVRPQYIIFEHVRDGAIIGVYRHDFNLETDLTVLGAQSGQLFRAPTDQYINQKVTISFSADTVPVTLTSEETENRKDIGVSLKYKSSLSTMVDRNQSYLTTTKYISSADVLSDEYSIRPHSIVELEFRQNYLEEIEGVELTGFGDVDVTIDAVTVTQFNAGSKENSKSYSAYTTREVTQRENKVEIPLTQCYDSDEAKNRNISSEPTVGFLWMTVESGIAGESYGSVNKQVPVRGVVTWADEAGNNRELIMNDIKDYIIEGEGIIPGQSATIGLPMNSFASLHSIKLIPYNVDSTTEMSWKPNSIRVRVLNPKTNSDVTIERNVDSIVTGSKTEEGWSGGTKINYADISFEGSVVYTYTNGEGSRVIPAENFKSGRSIRAEAGTEVIFTATNANNRFRTDYDKFIKGSYEDIDVVVWEVFGEGTSESTEIVENKVQTFRRYSSEYEGESDDNSVINRIVFRADGSQKRDVVYLLRIRSKEFPDKSIDFRITVPQIPEIVIDGGTDDLEPSPTTEPTGTPAQTPTDDTEETQTPTNDTEVTQTTEPTQTPEPTQAPEPTQEPEPTGNPNTDVIPVFEGND